MSRTRRALLILLIVVLVLVVVVPLGGWLYLRRSLPQTGGALRVRGLEAVVDVTRDASGIPYITAATDHDAFFALGYVHAQDRLWQMEMQRRIGSGRLAEVLGEPALKTDQFLRTLGPYRAAQAALPAMSERSRSALEAYASGINAWLAENHPLPPEFAVLGFRPQPWQPIDSLVWAKMMAWDLGGEYGLDILRARLAADLGPERARQLLPGYPPDAPSILAPDAVPQLRELQDAGRRVAALGIGGAARGSNDWVAAGSRTATGKPLLANDPHLRMQIPSVWYLAGVQGKSIHAVGATFPGLPTVVIGHNARIAWGVTNVNPDVQDIFVERINPANPNQYEVNGQWADMQLTAEEIQVKGRREALHWVARATRHGPLISDVTEKYRGNAFALRWTALDPGDTTIDAFMNINYAANWDDFKNAMRGFIVPSQNFVYADVDGNIGYFAPGHIPIRARGDGSVPVPGWNDDYAWKGWIPFDQLPQAYNPAAGYVVTANNRVTPPNYPYFVTNDWSPPYRANRIIQLLTARSGLTPDDYARIQGDQQSAQARELLPFLLTVQPRPDHPQEGRALDLLRAWDGTLSVDSVQASIYEAWFVALYPALLADKLGGPSADLITYSNPEFLRQVFDGRLSAWCDNVLTAPQETCPETARVALDAALDSLAESHGSDMSRWHWGDLHQVQFAHNPFSQVAVLKPIFHRAVPRGGDGYTVNPGGYELDAPFASTTGPSYREIIDLANFDNSRFMHTTGQSGNALSPHYADLIPRWSAVQYVPMCWTPACVKSTGATSTLLLEPEEAKR